MKALDLFCCAGGATRGLQRAGFTVHGIDIRKQRRYCGESFTRADALACGDRRWLGRFDLIWASPPCQRYSCGAAKWGTGNNHPDLIAPVREMLVAAAVPFVIENIAPAKRHLREPRLLCGQQFSLGVFRHRLFETSFPLAVPAHLPHIGRIGDGRFVTVTGHAGGSSRRDGWKNGGVEDARRAMGIDWMVWSEMAEAIPPAYSEYIARQFLESRQNMTNYTLTPEQYTALRSLIGQLEDIEDAGAGNDGEVFWLAGNVFLEDLDRVRGFLGRETAK